jgi:hypothetical protein
VRRHFEAMVFFNLAEELRSGDIAVTGSESTPMGAGSCWDGRPGTSAA